MDSLYQWVLNNFDTLFSGLGVYILSLLVGIFGVLFFRSRSSKNKVIQKDIAAGGDVVGRDKKG